jgi:ryanodine receptor 2
MSFSPKPIDTSKVELDADILRLTERLAENAHDVWARQRMADGWTYGPARDDASKKHPCLIPYRDLPESEKMYDRDTATETLRAILALGYQIQKTTHEPG